MNVVYVVAMVLMMILVIVVALYPIIYVKMAVMYATNLIVIMTPVKTLGILSQAVHFPQQTLRIFLVLN